MNIWNIPCVDNLIEGVHYTVVDWNFAEEDFLRDQQTNMPSRGMASTFADGQGCPEGEKMVFGVCRKPGQRKDDDKDFDSSKKTKEEEEGEAQAKKEGSDFKNNKMIKDIKTGKKLGWAMKNGRPVLVSWGSVAGEKKVGPKAPKAKNPRAQAMATSARANRGTAGLTQVGRDSYERAQDQNANNPNLNDAAREAARQNANRSRAGA